MTVYPTLLSPSWKINLSSWRHTIAYNLMLAFYGHWNNLRKLNFNKILKFIYSYVQATYSTATKFNVLFLTFDIGFSGIMYSLF